jgi:hypothetical protein
MECITRNPCCLSPTDCVIPAVCRRRIAGAVPPVKATTAFLIACPFLSSAFAFPLGRKEHFFLFNSESKRSTSFEFIRNRFLLPFQRPTVSPSAYSFTQSKLHTPSNSFAIHSGRSEEPAGGSGNGRGLLGQILSLSLSPLTTGLARAMASRPAALKSNAHAWRSGCRCTPHRHANPVRPTRFRQHAHRPLDSAGGGEGVGSEEAEVATETATPASVAAGRGSTWSRGPAWRGCRRSRSCWRTGCGRPATAAPPPWCRRKAGRGEGERLAAELVWNGKAEGGRDGVKRPKC